ncbi:hypothetical protein [Thalassoglobus sp.]|uniref:hypothetical protein n=1 Tax=Thalassoglobus sp. TaxID=2795869 RepID=UPI003AA9C716
MQTKIQQPLMSRRYDLFSWRLSIILSGVTSLTFMLVWSISILTAEEQQQKPPAPKIVNFRQVNKLLFSGAQPEGEEDFAALQKYGVKTIVCVDGTTPRVELARKYGLRYVHIPLPYSGIPRDSARKLAKVVEECESPIFVHCHHGLHRGPAAAAICGIAQKEMTSKTAIKFLKEVGTDPKYVGLFRDVGNYRLLSPSEDAKLPQVELVEIAPVDELSDIMTRIEEHFGIVEAQLESVTPNQQLIVEHSVAMSEEFKESARLKKLSEKLRTKFIEASKTSATLATDGEQEQLSKQLKNLKQQCVACHAEAG